MTHKELQKHDNVLGTHRKRGRTNFFFAKSPLTRGEEFNCVAEYGIVHSKIILKSSEGERLPTASPVLIVIGRR